MHDPRFSNYLRIIKLSFPIILANASVPLLGLVDTAAIGQTAPATHLGAIALAGLIFSFVYWGFGFLRMGTTGFVAQASGAKDHDRLLTLVFQTLLLGAVIGMALILLQWPVGAFSVALLSASPEIKELVKTYFYIRIWGAPATLMTFSLLGIFIGMGWTKRLLWMQICLNGSNILLNLLFVVGWGMGVKGIALGTLLAEWVALIFGMVLLLKKLDLVKPLYHLKRLKEQVLHKAQLLRIIKVNSDIMIRTFALLGGFAWFANQGASFGDSTLAANHVLLQFVTLSAFFLDGFAHVAEMLSGKAYGANNLAEFKLQVRQSTILAGITAVLLGLGVFLFSAQIIPLLTADAQVQAIAINYKNFAAIYILFSFLAFQLDGVFIGITRSKEMRNATLAAFVGFLAIGLLLVHFYGNYGLWTAFVAYVLIRALALGYYFPRIIADFSSKN